MRKVMYLLTGAAGNLGSSISRELIKQGKIVRAFILPGDPAATRVPRKAEIVFGNVLNDMELERFFHNPEDAELIVIHCAAIVTTYPEYNQKVYDVNVTGTKNIVEKCIEHKVKKLVYVSSTSAIPEFPRGQRICETTVFDPNTVIGFYAKTKAEASQVVMDAVNKDGLDASIVFPTGICGPEDYAYGHITQLLIDYVKGKMQAGIMGGFDAVDVRDLAKGIISCAEKGRTGEGYIMGKQFVTLKEIFHIISERTGVREITTMIPVWLAKAIVPFASVYYKIMKRPPAFTDFALYNLTRNNDYSSDKAKRELGYSTRPFTETIADVLTWLKEEKKI
jgi:dihydroflavonol-4-reductase